MWKQIFLILFIVSSSLAIQFSLKPNSEKCLKYDFNQDDIVSGFVEVQPDPSRQLSFKISEGQNFIYENRDIKTIANFAFTAFKDDDYDFCFSDVSNSASYPRVVTVKVRTGDPKKKINYTEIARIEHLQPIELQARRIEDTARRIEEDFMYMKHRELTHRDTSESTNLRVSTMTAISVLIVAALGIGQVIYLKRYFKSKKLI